MNNDTVLCLNNLSKRFGTIVANESVSIDLKRGEILSLLGENGAGKTTLMNMLFGHYMLALAWSTSTLLWPKTYLLLIIFY